MTHCCADCGVEGGASLKSCKSCMLVRYCNADCQRNHWPKHKNLCKQRAAELRDEALFEDPPAKEDCPICFLPMPQKLICCISLPPATIQSVPIYDFANEHQELADEPTEEFFPCCGKRICRGCEYSFNQTGNESNCPFCNSDHGGKPVEEEVADMMKRVAANDPASICMLATHYHLGRAGFQQNHAKTVELLTKSAELGFSKAHSLLGNVYYIGGTSKKAKFHYEAAAMAGDEVSRYNLAICENELGNMDRAVKHLKIGASAGDSRAMHQLRTFFEEGTVSRESIDSTLIAYNNSCAEMRSEARDAYMRRFY